MRLTHLLLAASLLAAFASGHAATDLSIQFRPTLDTLGDFEMREGSHWQHGAGGYARYNMSFYRLVDEPGAEEPTRQYLWSRSKWENGNIGAGYTAPALYLDEVLPVHGSVSAGMRRLSTQLHFDGQPGGGTVHGYWQRPFVLAAGESASFGGVFSFELNGSDLPALGQPLAWDLAPVTLTMGAKGSAQAALSLTGDDLSFSGGIAVSFDNSAAVVNRHVDPASGLLTLNISNPTGGDIQGYFYTGSLLQIALTSPVPEPAVYLGLLAGLLLLGAQGMRSGTRRA